MIFFLPFSSKNCFLKIISHFQQRISHSKFILFKYFPTVLEKNSHLIQPFSLVHTLYHLCDQTCLAAVSKWKTKLTLNVMHLYFSFLIYFIEKCSLAVVLFYVCTIKKLVKWGQLESCNGSLWKWIFGLSKFLVFVLTRKYVYAISYTIFLNRSDMKIFSNNVHMLLEIIIYYG